LPTVVGLGVVWGVICQRLQGRWRKSTPLPQITAPTFNLWQTGKGLFVIVLLVLVFLATPWPHDVVALTAAGVLLTSRRMASRDILGLVDWQLLVLFVGLFVVNHALGVSGMLSHLAALVEARGIHLQQPAWLFTITVVLSNVISNVPAVMLLLPMASHPFAGPILALASTLAGNLFLVGSIANIIVVDQAAKLGVRITWQEHVRVGIPVTLLTLTLAAGWLWLRATWFLR